MRTGPEASSLMLGKTLPQSADGLGRGGGPALGCWAQVAPHCQQVPLFLTTQTGDHEGGVGSLCLPCLTWNSYPLSCRVFRNRRRNLGAPPRAYLLLRPCCRGWPCPSKPHRKWPVSNRGQWHGQHGLTAPAHLTQGQSGSGGSQALIWFLLLLYSLQWVSQLYVTPQMAA